MDEHVVRSGDALFRSGDGQRIVEWNRAAEELTGIPAADAVGRPCWEVIAGRDEDGGIVCHPGCSIARLAREDWPVSCTNLVLRGPAGVKRVSISTIVVQNGHGPLILHPMRPTESPSNGRQPPDMPALTPRQREILELLASGIRVREIADRLTLSETTVRNHVRALLLELGVHSQLEAVAKAREFVLVGG